MVIQIVLGVFSKSYDVFVQAVICQDDLSNFEKLCRKFLLEEAR